MTVAFIELTLYRADGMVERWNRVTRVEHDTATRVVGFWRERAASPALVYRLHYGPNDAVLVCYEEASALLTVPGGE